MRGAEIECQARGFSLEEVFVHQFILGPKDVAAPDGWRRTGSLDDWSLAHCPRLPCQPIRDARGEPVGWILGVAVDAEGALASAVAVDFTVHRGAPDFWDAAEAWLTGLAGKFVVFLFAADGGRVYADPVVDLPVVFNARGRLVAASPLLALPREMQLNPKIDREAIQKHGGNYGLQMTCDPDVRRMLANHFLDLNEFSLTRHWPTPDFKASQDPSDLRAISMHAVRRMGSVVRALVGGHSCALPISGGCDSRTLAYAMRCDLGRLAYCFVHSDNWMTQLDTYVAREVARDLGQDLLAIDGRAALAQRKVTRRDVRQRKRLFTLRTGFQLPPRIPQFASAALLPEVDIVLRGNILDMTRANQWPAEIGAFDPDHGLSKLAIGGDPDGRQLAARKEVYLRWFATVPDSHKHRAYDMAFVEQLLPNTLGARLMGYGDALYVNPFNDRRLIEDCLRVSPAIRQRGMLARAMLNAAGSPRIPMTSHVQRDPVLKARAEAMFSEPQPIRVFSAEAE